MRARFPIVALLGLLATLLPSAWAEDLPWQRIDLPEGAVNPRAAGDHRGRIHIVYGWRGKPEEARYVRWEADQLSEPKSLNQDQPAVIGGERGPQIAVANDGTIAAIWQTPKGMQVVLSRDAGATWSPIEVRERGAKGGVDCPTIGADHRGNLIAVWIDGRGEDRGTASANLYAATLAAGGKQFGPNLRVTTERLAACACCMPRVAADQDGTFYIACRGEDKQVREIALFSTEDGGTTWEGRAVTSDNWRFHGCPMSGPALAVAPDGKSILLAWRTDKKLRWAISRDAGRRFSAGADLADRVSARDYGFAGFNADGAGFLIYTVDRKWQALQISSKTEKTTSLAAPLESGSGMLLRTQDNRLFLIAGRGEP